MIPNYERLATGRTKSIFYEDMNESRDELSQKIKGSRIAIIGAAGSIGASVVKQVLHFEPGSLELFDLSENNLVEVVRELRSSPEIKLPDCFSALAIGLGSKEFFHYFKTNQSFDYVLNLAAMKHVRSEKDIYSLSRLIDTNIRFVYEFLRDLPYDLKGFFSVSSDKAANPGNLMGASKNAMEQACFAFSSRHHCTSARFANVAFSDGSLPYSFIKRWEKNQCLAAPSDVKRYFISHEEAGQLCVLATFLGKQGNVFIPRLEEGLNERTFSEIARGFLKLKGYSVSALDSEDAAKEAMINIVDKKEWPCFFVNSDTSGEKMFEEFVGNEEKACSAKLHKVEIINRRLGSSEIAGLERFLEKTSQIFENSMNKEDVVALFRELVPSLSHIERGKNLDQKM